MLKKPAFDSLRVTWTLAIEEQFYIGWPIIVRYAPRRLLKPLALLAVFISLAARWSATVGLTPPLNTYTNTLARLDGLGLGAFLALWIPETKSRNVRLAGGAAIALALPATIAVGWFQSGHWSFYTLVSVCFAGLLCVAVSVPLSGNWAFLRYTGKISYALYLFHVPVLEFLHSPDIRAHFRLRAPVPNDLLLLALSFMACYGLASASWYFLESKFLRLKSRFEFRSTPRPLSPAPEHHHSVALFPAKSAGE